MRLFQVDAFTSRLFSGSPASVVILDSELPDSLLLDIAKENSLPETAFILKKDSNYHLRWFTPDIEMDLCGHATLAAAFVLFNYIDMDSKEIIFSTKSGDILVSKEEGEKICLTFPIRIGVETQLPKDIYNSLNIKPIKVYKSRDYHLIYNSQKEIEDLVVDRAELDKINIDPGGVVVTAKGDDCDFVTRFFTPQATIMEDPVTGSACCTTVPYWSDILKKESLFVRQLSKRGGDIWVTITNGALLIKGNAVVYSKSEIVL